MIETAALLRLIPYLLVGYIAWLKGFRRLTLAALFVTCTATLNFVVDMSPELRAVFGAIFSFLLLLHALNLKPRKSL